MKHQYFSIARSIVFLYCIISYSSAFSQMEIKTFFSLPHDVNNSGRAVGLNNYFDFSTSNQNSNSFLGSSQIFGLNNSEYYLGKMPITINGQTITQPAYRMNGFWYAMGYPAAADETAIFTLSQISENSNYITGQIAATCCNSNAFLYNRTTGSYQMIPTPAGFQSFGASVNDAGIIVGWQQSLSTGLRTPVFMSGTTLTAVPGLSTGQVNAINASNVMVGGDDVPFIYNLSTNSLVQFTIPSEYQSGTFTDIADNGTVVGYYVKVTPTGTEYLAMVYDPAVSAEPVLLDDILNANGISNNPLGVATAISPDGNYIVGGGDPDYVYSGWAVKLNGMLAASCILNCPEPIISPDPVTGILDYSITFDCNQHPNASVVLVSGLPSGSVFPTGATQVIHNLVDPDGTVVATCDFWVIAGVYYCQPVMDNPIPITEVTMNGASNVSDANSTEFYEDFTNVTMWMPEVSNPITMKGSTGGNYTDYYTVFFDWNYDGDFDDNGERFDAGTITNSTGVDGIELNANITASNQFWNPVRMRIIKMRGAYVFDGCPASGEGQIEDYSLLGTNLGLNTNDLDRIRISPNPATDLLTILGNSTLHAIYVYNLLGQEVLQAKPQVTSIQLDIGSLQAGTYLVKCFSGQAVKTFKLIKQ